MTATDATLDRTRAAWQPRGNVLLVSAYVSWAVATIYFLNGLTSPQAKARVVVSGADSEVTLPSGWLTDAGTTAVLHYGEVYKMGDRLATRLSLLALFGTVGLFLFAMGRLARAYAAGGAEKVARAHFAWMLLAGAALSAAFVVPFADWAQAATVLEVAGRPAGLEPYFSASWGWTFAAAAIVTARALLSQLDPSRRAASAADTG